MCFSLVWLGSTTTTLSADVGCEAVRGLCEENGIVQAGGKGWDLGQMGAGNAVVDDEGESSQNNTLRDQGAGKSRRQEK